jgi:hypothetical protein
MGEPSAFTTAIRHGSGVTLGAPRAASMISSNPALTKSSQVGA